MIENEKMKYIKGRAANTPNSLIPLFSVRNIRYFNSEFSDSNRQLLKKKKGFLKHPEYWYLWQSKSGY